MASAARRDVAVWLGLLALSGATLGFSFLGLGPWGPVVALAIASAKAGLIAAFYMHLVEQRPVNALVGAATLLLVAAFLGLAAADVATRPDRAVPPWSAGEGAPAP